MKTKLAWILLMILTSSGCTAPIADPSSEQAARRYFNAEFQKWIAGEKTDLKTIGTSGNSPPISYDIRSVVPTEPSWMAYSDGQMPIETKGWVGYQFNVVTEWESQAERPIEKVIKYRLTWNADEKRWYAEERL